MSKPHIELLIEDENGQDVVAYPFIEADHVTLSNGMDLDCMIDQDISMPTVTHDETSFKVGVGDSDVSSSIVDSSVGKMVIKGQTYQNILPEPTLRNEMQGKSMQRLNEGYDSIETVDGVSKSAILKGQTLVNLCPDSVYTNQGWSDGVYKTFNDFPLLIKGKKYTIYSPIGDKTGNPGDGLVDLYVKNGESVTRIYRTYGNGHDTIHKTFTMGDVLEFNNYSITGERFKQNYPNVMILEGEWNLHEIPNYFKGMASCKMPVLTTVGKNLFDVNDSNNLGSSISKEGETLTSVATCPVVFGYNGLDSTKQYTISFDIYKNSDGRPNSLMYSLSDKNVPYTTTENSYNITLKGNYTTGVTTRERVTIKGKSEVWVQAGGDITFSNIQIEEGSVATSYEPYKSNILSCQLAPLNQTMFEQGTFAEATPPNTQSYEQIKLGSEHLYTTRIRTKGTYKVVKGATYEVRLNDGYGIYVCYCKNGLYSATVNRWLDGTSTFTVPNDCDEMFFAIRKTDNTAIAPSDYPLIGLKIHQEVILRSLPNDTKDTLNLNTGEYVQRIGEVTLNGSEEWAMDNEASDSKENTSIFYSQKFTQFKKLEVNERNSGIVCNGYPVKGDVYGSDVEGMMFNHVNVFYFRVKKSVANNVGDFKQWLSQNPKEVQLELGTPIIKTVDLSILDQNGDTQENLHSFANGHLQVSSEAENSLLPSVQYEIPTKNSYHMDLMKTNTLYTMKAKSVSGTFTIDDTSYNVNANGTFTSPSSMTDKLLIMSNKTNEEVMLLEGNVIDKTIPYFKGIKSAFEGEDKIEVLSTGKNLFDKHTVLFSHSTDANGTVISSPQYAVSELISVRPNTVYTVKHFVVVVMYDKDKKYISQLNADYEQRTFTTPATCAYVRIRNWGLLDGVELQKQMSEKVVLQEGDTIVSYEPYKSNSTKIPLLSINDILNKKDYRVATDAIMFDNVYLNPSSEYIFTTDYTFTDKVKIEIVQNRTITMVQSVYGWEKYSDPIKFTTSPDIKGLYSIKIWSAGLNDNEIFIKTTRLGLMGDKTHYLKSLHSLPNGVCDEIVLDRENNKAQIIQRVGEATFVGSEDEEWAMSTNSSASGNPYRYDTRILSGQFKGESDPNVAPKSLLCDQYMTTFFHAVYGGTRKGIALYNNTHFVIQDGTDNLTEFKTHLQSNPTTVYYELANPIITEVDMLGYPFVYKDGHIFLNSEIAPTTEITYSINQCQQISASNEDILRHEKELTYLQKLIAQYVQVDYESVLLSLKV